MERQRGSPTLIEVIRTRTAPQHWSRAWLTLWVAVVAISRSGTTTEVVRVLEALGDGAPTVAITAVPGTPVFSNVAYSSFTVTWGTSGNPANTPYEISLAGHTYDAVIGGFGWVAPPAGMTLQQRDSGPPLVFDVDGIEWE